MSQKFEYQLEKRNIAVEFDNTAAGLFEELPNEQENDASVCQDHNKFTMQDSNSSEIRTYFDLMLTFIITSFCEQAKPL